MAGSDSSVRGGHRGEHEAPIQRAELHRLQNSLLDAMERMFNERLPAGDRRERRHQHEDSSDENSSFMHGSHVHFRGGRDDRCGGGRRADQVQPRRVPAAPQVECGVKNSINGASTRALQQRGSAPVHGFVTHVRS